MAGDEQDTRRASRERRPPFSGGKCGLTMFREPQRCGSEPQRRGPLPQRCGSEARRRGPLPQRRGSEAQRRGPPPQRCGSEAQRRGPPPQRCASEPRRRGSRPRRRPNSAQRHASEPRRRGPRPRRRPKSVQRRASGPRRRGLRPRRRPKSVQRRASEARRRGPEPRRRPKSVQRRASIRWAPAIRPVTASNGTHLKGEIRCRRAWPGPEDLRRLAGARQPPDPPRPSVRPEGARHRLLPGASRVLGTKHLGISTPPPPIAAKIPLRARHS